MSGKRPQKLDTFLVSIVSFTIPVQKQQIKQ